MRVAVIGSSRVADEHYQQAREVGRILGERDHEIVCGGRTGVMEAVCRGGQETGAHTIGLLPSEYREEANEYVETAIATGLGNARNALVALNGDAAIAVDGSTGTLSEIALSLDRGIPVAGLDSYEIESVECVATPADAVAYVEQARE